MMSIRETMKLRMVNVALAGLCIYICYIAADYFFHQGTIGGVTGALLASGIVKLVNR
ncbi:hypothetical protein ACFL6Y_10190 [Elusimicrobiota bacterium]